MAWNHWLRMRGGTTGRRTRQARRWISCVAPAAEVCESRQLLSADVAAAEVEEICKGRQPQNEAVEVAENAASEAAWQSIDNASRKWSNHSWDFRECVEIDGLGFGALTTDGHGNFLFRNSDYGYKYRPVDVVSNHSEWFTICDPTSGRVLNDVSASYVRNAINREPPSLQEYNPESFVPLCPISLQPGPGPTVPEPTPPVVEGGQPIEVPKVESGIEEPMPPVVESGQPIVIPNVESEIEETVDSWVENVVLPYEAESDFEDISTVETISETDFEEGLEIDLIEEAEAESDADIEVTDELPTELEALDELFCVWDGLEESELQLE